MNRRGKVYCQGLLAGRLEERPGGYSFTYNTRYLALKDACPISLSLALRHEPYESPVLFPFFYGLLAEGVLKDAQCRKLKLDENDHFGRLLKTAGSDTIGDVTVTEETEAADA